MLQKFALAGTSAKTCMSMGQCTKVSCIDFYAVHMSEQCVRMRQNMGKDDNFLGNL